MKNYKTNLNNTYGNMLCQEDFATYFEDEQYDDFHSLSGIANRIANDLKFEEKLRKNAEKRDKIMAKRN